MSTVFRVITKFSAPLIGLAAFVATVVDTKPASAITYTFINAVANDTINQNTGSATISGSFDAPTGATRDGVNPATNANITLNFGNPPASVGGNGSYFFNRVYFDAALGGNGALIFFCVNTCTTPPGGFNSSNLNDATYQMILGFNQDIDFADPTFNFPSKINLVSLNNGNINQLCASLDSGDVGTNTCDQGENNRFEFSNFSSGTLEVPGSVSFLVLGPVAATLTRLRKRYKHPVTSFPSLEAI